MSSVAAMVDEVEMLDETLGGRGAGASITGAEGCIGETGTRRIAGPREEGGSAVSIVEYSELKWLSVADVDDRSNIIDDVCDSGRRVALGIGGRERTEVKSEVYEETSKPRMRNWEYYAEWHCPQGPRLCTHAAIGSYGRVRRS